MLPPSRSTSCRQPPRLRRRQLHRLPPRAAHHHRHHPLQPLNRRAHLALAPVRAQARALRRAQGRPQALYCPTWSAVLEWSQAVLLSRTRPTPAVTMTETMTSARTSVLVDEQICAELAVSAAGRPAAFAWSKSKAASRRSSWSRPDELRNRRLIWRRLRRDMRTCSRLSVRAICSTCSIVVTIQPPYLLCTAA